MLFSFIHFKMNLYRQISKGFILCVFVLMFGTIKTGWAGTYYVNNSGTAACNNIASNGSKANPWCTISYGISRISSGDTLYVMAGTYNEVLYINSPAGTAGKPTVIKAYPGNVVNIFGLGVSTGRVKIINTSYLTLDGFRVTNHNQGIFVESANNIKILNCEVYNIGQDGIGIHYNSSYVTVQNCIVHDTRQWQYNGEGIYIGTGSGGPLDNTNNVTVRNNIIYNTTDEGIELKPATHDILVEGNVLYNIMTDPNYSAGGGAIEVNPATISCPNCPNGLQTWPSNPNQVIRNNIVHSCKTGIRAGTGSMVYNNLVYDIPDPFYGILVNNSAADSYLRTIYQNTVDVPSNRAIVVTSGAADVKNNIGPSTAYNLVSNNSYFVDIVSVKKDYHLVPGSAPINAGVVTNILTDLDGNVRPQGGGYDIGAYEYGSGTGTLNNQFIKQQIKIYPNPTNDKLFFENIPGELLTMNAGIYNALGEKLLNKNIDLKTEKILDVSGLSPGIYFVQLSNETTRQNSKIVIAH
jgi:parallel beta-helix repeat protein